MRTRLFSSVIATASTAILLSSLGTRAQTTAPSKIEVPQPSIEKDWQSFRTTYPFHLQTIALSEPDAAGARTLIISEPPPHVTTAGLTAVDPKLLAAPAVMTHTIGFDGWVKDAVFALPRMEDTALTGLVEKLSNYLFGTSYKASALPFASSIDHTEVNYPLDVRVRTVDIERWYGDLRYRPMDGGPAVALGDAPLGVYCSADPGIIAWVLPRKGIERRQVDIRKFALDADLVLGAVARKDAVVVLGRERVAPLTVLPPLRTESVVDLARAAEAKLSQSYERNLFGAGPIGVARWDWAPIYLSPELLDSEYGSLLNLTDQILKGYSLCGQVEYHNFPHTAPSRFPFDAPLITQLQAQQLLFNWNTIGFGMSTDTGSLSLYSPTRTGALPMIYRPDEASNASAAVVRAEEKAYAYFASLNDPLLARVVQYASLYQIFRTYEVVAPAVFEPAWDQSAALRRAAIATLESFRKSTKESLKRRLDAVLVEVDARFFASGESLPADLRKEFEEGLSKLHTDYAAFYEARGARGEANVASLLARTRTSSFDPDVDPLDIPMALDVNRWNLSIFGFSEEIQKEFSKSRGATRGDWIRTPTVVFSRSMSILATMTGGHDVDSKVGRVVRDAMQSKGKVRVAADGSIHCHPEDAAIVEARARLIASVKNKAVLERRLATAIKTTPPEVARPMAQVLERADYHTAERGFSREMHVLAPKVPSSGGGKLPPPPGSRPIATPPSDAGLPRPVAFEVLRVDAEKDVLQLRRARPDGVIAGTELWNRREVVYALTESLTSGGRAVDGKLGRIRFGAGFEATEVARIMDDVALRLSRDGGSRRAIGYFVHEGAEARLAQRATKARLGAVDVTETGVPAARTRRVKGTVYASAGATNDVTVSFEVHVVGGKDVDVNALKKSLSTSLDDAVGRQIRLEDIPPEIHEALLRDLDAAKGSHGTFKVADFCDVHIVRSDRVAPERPLTAASVAAVAQATGRR